MQSQHQQDINPSYESLLFQTYQQNDNQKYNFEPQQQYNQINQHSYDHQINQFSNISENYDSSQYQQQNRGNQDYHQMNKSKEEQIFISNTENLSNITDRNQHQQQKERRKQENVKKPKKKKKKQKQANKEHKIKDEHAYNTESIKKNYQKKNDLNISIPKKTESSYKSLAISFSSQPLQKSPTQHKVIIKEAQKQRILSAYLIFTQFISKHNLHIKNQRSVIQNVYEEINRRKLKKYVWYHLLKQYFAQYKILSKNFREESYELNKQQILQNKNKFLNIGEQLKQASDQLKFLKRSVGNSYNDFSSFLGSRLSRQLQLAINNFLNQMSKAQQSINDKKKEYLEMQDQLQAKTKALLKVFNKGIQGKKQDEDVFIETCKFIIFQKKFRHSLICWGKGLLELRITLKARQIKLSEDLQAILNLFKNEQRSLYSLHQQGFSTILNSKQEIIKLSTFSNLCTLPDTDYIKYTIEMTQKIQIAEITDKHFEQFIEIPHFEQLTRQPQNILKGMINKSFKLKDNNETLVNTIAGNLVQFNNETLQHTHKFIAKNLQANIIAEGVVQFDQIIHGIIFNNHRTLRIALKNQDTAEELICLLNQKITNNLQTHKENKQF